ncbi:MAG TPA: hypothetical protein VLI93_17575 [Acetobacteraceae bacterium]|nr:hypothetical protein [Acetobacteraceae bacterium]
MRSLLLSFTAVSLLAAAPALAQTSYQSGTTGAGGHYAAPPGQGKVVTGPPGLPSVQPLSRRASNINSADTRTKIAPALPAVDVGPNATPSDYLRAAQNALASGQTGRAQEALESAETRILSRSAPADVAGQPDQNPAVRNINSALQALGSHDVQSAMQLVQQTIPMADQMQTAASGPMATPTATGPMVGSP